MGYVSDTAYLYDKGTFGAGVTSYSKLLRAGTTTISVSNDIITASVLGGASDRTMFRFNQTVDLTDWNYLKVIPTTSNVWTGVGIGIATWPNYTSASDVTLLDAYSETKLSSSNSCSTQICDISKFSGKYYVFFWFKMGSSSNQTRTAGIGQTCFSNT